jgi:hydroxymethylbilane synthase
VHSAKDLPAVTPFDLVIAAIPERADPRDALVGARLDAIPSGGTVGTGAVRRRAQLGAIRPDLNFEELRGNIDTRIAKASGFDAVVIAVAALERMRRVEVATEILPLDVMLPQVGQGALAVECRAGDTATRELLATVDDTSVHRLVAIERAFLARLGGGCDLPVGAHARDAANGRVTLRVFLETDGEARTGEVEAGADDPPDEIAARALAAIRPEAIGPAS